MQNSSRGQLSVSAGNDIHAWLCELCVHKSLRNQPFLCIINIILHERGDDQSSLPP